MSLVQRNHEDEEGREPRGRLLSAANPPASATASAPEPEPTEGLVCFSQNDFISATLETDPMLRLPAAPPAATSPTRSPPGAATFGTAMAGPPAASPPSEAGWPEGNAASDVGGCMDSRREGALDVVRDEGALASDAGGRDDLKDRVSLLSEYGCDTPAPEGGTLTLLIGDKLKLTLVSLD